MIHVGDQFCDGRHAWSGGKITWHDGRGNVSFATNDEYITQVVQDLSNGESMYEPPKCAEDLRGGELDTLVKEIEEIAT